MFCISNIPSLQRFLLTGNIKSIEADLFRNKKYSDVRQYVKQTYAIWVFQ